MVDLDFEALSRQCDRIGGNWYFAGDLGAAIVGALNSRIPHVSHAGQGPNTTWLVELWDLDESAVAEWGYAKTSMEAWRFALGAYYYNPEVNDDGPANDTTAVAGTEVAAPGRA